MAERIRNREEIILSKADEKQCVVCTFPKKMGELGVLCACIISGMTQMKTLREMRMN